jgi:tetratricopeptide (TPR) repeat protein
MSVNQHKKTDMDAFIKNGISLLKKNLERYPSFDPDRPYPEKNEYFNELSRRGHENLFSHGLHGEAELYYEALLKIILEYERTYNKKFNKGMVYANLGIAQMATGKFDAGIVHLLRAGEEDQPIAPDFNILNTRLWKQFENSKIFYYLINLNMSPDAGLAFVDEPFLSDLVRGMEQQDRIFFEGTIWILRDNLHQHHAFPNAYTRGRLYSSLKDLCLLTEALLRKKQIVDRVITTASEITLHRLLVNVLSNDYPQTDLKTKASNIQEFLNNLEPILENDKATLRYVYCLHLVRNFTGHHFDLSETITSPKGRTFFELYETVLTNILSAVMYFKSIDAI